MDDLIIDVKRRRWFNSRESTFGSHIAREKKFEVGGNIFKIVSQGQRAEGQDLVS